MIENIVYHRENDAMHPKAKQDEPLYQAQLHPIVFFQPMVLIVLAAILAWCYPWLNPVSYMLLLVGLAWLGIGALDFKFTKMQVHTSHVSLQTGWLVRNRTDIPVNKIESVDIRQSILGSVFGFGEIIITGSGGTRQKMVDVAAPLTCRRYIEQVLSSPLS